LVIAVFVVGVVFGAILLQSFNNSNPSVQETNDANPDDSGPTIGFMGTEEFKITSVTFDSGHIYVNATNTGTSAVTINEVWVNGAPTTDVTTGDGVSIVANSTQFVITTTVGAGYNYQVKLVSSKGNPFIYTATAPS